MVAFQWKVGRFARDAHNHARIVNRLSENVGWKKPTIVDLQCVRDTVEIWFDPVWVVDPITPPIRGVEGDDQANVAFSWNLDLRCQRGVPGPRAMLRDDLALAAPMPFIVAR